MTDPLRERAYNWIKETLPQPTTWGVEDSLTCLLHSVAQEENERCAKEVESLRWPAEDLDDDRAKLNDGFTTAAQCIRVLRSPQAKENDK